MCKYIKKKINKNYNIEPHEARIFFKYEQGRRNKATKNTYCIR